MASLIRSFDWSKTPLGPIEKWSRELLTIVNLTLSSSAPARTIWGPDFVLIYNDAYRALPGTRHPEALGQPAREIYKEAWHVIGPLLERAYASGETCCYEKLVVPLSIGEGIEERVQNHTFHPVYDWRVGSPACSVRCRT